MRLVEKYVQLRDRTSRTQALRDSSIDGQFSLSITQDLILCKHYHVTTTGREIIRQLRDKTSKIWAKLVETQLVQRSLSLIK